MCVCCVNSSVAGLAVATAQLHYVIMSLHHRPQISVTVVLILWRFPTGPADRQEMSASLLQARFALLGETNSLSANKNDHDHLF